MAKRKQKRKTQERETNWLIIGGIIAVGLIAFGGLLYLALRTPSAEPVQTLTEYCAGNPNNCVTVGDQSAPVTLIEVSDFGCPHCTNFHQNTAGQLKEEFVDTGSVKWVFLPYSLRPATVPAAAAAMCANDQDAFLPFIEAMFGIEDVDRRLSAAGIRDAAEIAGINADDVAACLDSGTYARIVDENIDAARKVDVTGTPTFFVNDETLNGNQPLSVFQQAFAEAISN